MNLIYCLLKLLKLFWHWKDLLLLLLLFFKLHNRKINLAGLAVNGGNSIPSCSWVLDLAVLLRLRGLLGTSAVALDKQAHVDQASDGKAHHVSMEEVAVI